MPNEITRDNSSVVVVVLIAAVVVLVVIVVGLILYFRMREKRIMKKVSRDVESGSDSEYSYSSEESEV